MPNKHFIYTNSLGYVKELVVCMTPNDEGKYPVTLWCRTNGEYAGSGEMTRQEINDYLEHFGVGDRI